MVRNRFFRRDLVIFLKIYQAQIRFLIWFALLFLVLSFLYFLLVDTFIQDFIFSSLTARPAAAVIQFISPGERIRVEGNLLISEHAALSIVHGCEGAQGILILTAAILAYRMNALRKLSGVLCGIVFLYIVNLLRIVGVYFVVKYHRGALDVAHFYVGQTFVIVMMFAFFILWVQRRIDGR